MEKETDKAQPQNHSQQQQQPPQSQSRHSNPHHHHHNQYPHYQPRGNRPFRGGGRGFYNGNSNYHQHHHHHNHNPRHQFHHQHQQSNGREYRSLSQPRHVDIPYTTYQQPPPPPPPLPQQQEGKTNGSKSSIGSSVSSTYIQPKNSNLLMWKSLMKRHNELVQDKLRYFKARDLGVKDSNTNRGADLQPEGSKSSTSNKEEGHGGGPITAKDGGNVTTGQPENRQQNGIPVVVSGGGNSAGLKKVKGGDYGNNEKDNDYSYKFQQRERSVNLDINQFLQDVERQLLGLDRKSASDAKLILEELELRDQHLTICYQRLVGLEDRNQRCMDELEYYKGLTNQLQQASVQREQEFEVEKEEIIQKAKSEAITQLIRLSPGLWQQDPFLSPIAPKPGESPAEFLDLSLLTSAVFDACIADNSSPCLQPMPSDNEDGVVTDLRDRYEDLKCLGVMDKTCSTEWVKEMIRKVVSHYETIGIRVYEESIPNLFLSTIMMCPNKQLYPDKSEGTLSTAYAKTQLQATEFALQPVYTKIFHGIQKECELKDESERDNDIASENSNKEDMHEILSTSTPTVDKAKEQPSSEQE